MIRKHGSTLLMAALFCWPLLGLSACSATPASPFDGARAFADLEAIVALGPRVAGTPESAATRAYIRAELESVGVAYREQRFVADTPLGERSMTNVIAEIEGTEPGVIVLSNHYDTKYFRDFTFVGANDAGSTTAWMIEMARTLGPKREGYTLWLVWFDGEEAFEEWTPEDSLYGSRHMVADLAASGGLDRVRAMINVDMIGDCDLTVLVDPGAPVWLRDIVWTAADELGYGEAFTPIVRSMEDDHKPFRDAGVPAMNLIDFRYGGGRAEHDRNWHTPRDTIDRVCADSLQAVGDVLYHALPRIDRAIAQGAGS